MKLHILALSLLSLAILHSPLRADETQRNAPTQVLPPQLTWTPSGQVIATASTGVSIVGWLPSGGGLSGVQLAILAKDGTFIVPPTALGHPSGTQQSDLLVAATNFNFIVCWREVTSSAGGNQTVAARYEIFTHQGLPVSGGVANSMTLATQAPADLCLAATRNDLFVIGWARRDFGGIGFPTSSHGVWARRFDGTGAALDSQEFRVDGTPPWNPSNNLDQRQLVAAMGTDASLAFAWRDGDSSLSPDGNGTAVVAAFLGPTLTSLSGAGQVVNTTTLGDQSNPRIAADDRGRCVIAWNGPNGSGGTQIYTRRYLMTGSPLDAGNVQLTPLQTPGGPVVFPNSLIALSGLAMDSAGNYAVSWQRLLNSSGLSGENLVARMNRDGSLEEVAIIEPYSSGSNETYSQPSLSMDVFGNLYTFYRHKVSFSTGLRFRSFTRQTLSFQPPSPLPGTTTTLSVDSPNDANAPFWVIPSQGSGPVLIDSRYAPLSYDLVAQFSFVPNNGIFVGFQGTLDATGQGSASLVIPPIAGLTGTTLRFGLVTFSPTAPSGIETISDAFELTIN